MNAFLFTLLFLPYLSLAVDVYLGWGQWCYERLAEAGRLVQAAAQQRRALSPDAGRVEAAGGADLVVGRRYQAALDAAQDLLHRLDAGPPGMAKHERLAITLFSILNAMNAAERPPRHGSDPLWVS